MKQARGFTLIEMAIVLVIITILIGGLAMPLSAQIQARRIAETKQTMEEARMAILGFAMTHPAETAGSRYLPCPDIDGDGRENRVLVTKSCELSYGLLPWVDLGVAPHDAWGNRLRYAVVPDFADGISGFSASTVLNNPLQICITNSCPTPYDPVLIPNPYVAADVVFVLVSHGPNGWGAQNMNNTPGSLQADPTGPDEADNLNANQTYISRSPTKPGDASGEFDDLVTWVSHPQLIVRICPTSSDCNPLPAP